MNLTRFSANVDPRIATKSSEEITNAFLAEFTGKEEGIWVIGATNRRDVVDDAILSRLGWSSNWPAR